MWQATKIELRKNSDTEYYRERALYFSECYSLFINDEQISHSIYPEYLTLNCDDLDVNTCTECGFGGCNGAGMLNIRRQGESIIFVPDIVEAGDFQEYIYETGEGDRYCPPHRWYEEGILIVEGDALKELFRLLPQFNIKKIPIISQEEKDFILKWEYHVKTKPKGFMNERENE